MRKQLFAGLIAATALLFSVFALTSSPAASNYAAYPSASGNVISGTAAGDCPCVVTATLPDGTTISTTVPVSGGAWSFTLPVGTNGSIPLTINGSDAGAVSVTGVVTTTTTGTTGTTATTTTGTTAATTTTTTGTTGTVITAADAGFTNGIPAHPGKKAPALAVTGTSTTSVLGFIATGLIALGAVAMGSREKFLQGALED